MPSDDYRKSQAKDLQNNDSGFSERTNGATTAKHEELNLDLGLALDVYRL